MALAVAQHELQLHYEMWMTKCRHLAMLRVTSILRLVSHVILVYVQFLYYEMFAFIKGEFCIVFVKL